MFRKNTAGQFIHFQGVDATTGGIKSGVSWTIRRCIDGTFAAGGGTVTEDGSTGWYKCALSQADTNGNDIGFNFTGTGAVPQTVNIVTTAGDPTDSVRFGLTALPNAAANAAGGLPISTAGGLDLDEMNVDIEAIQASTAGLTFTGAGKVDASVRDWVGDTIPARNVTGVPIVDCKYLLGTIFVTPATSGIMDVNAKNWGNSVVTGMPMPTYTQPTGFLAEDFSELDADIEAIQAAQLTGAQMATAIWQDTTAADFTTALSIGKSILNGVSLGTGLTINAYTGNTAQTGDSFARLGAPAGASIAADLVEIEAETDGIAAIPTTPLLAANVPTNFAAMAITAGGIVQADLQTIKTQTVTCAAGVTVLASVGTAATSTAQTGDNFARLGAPAGASIAADLAEIEAETDLASALMTTQLTESYNADGTAPTPAQALMLILQRVTEFSIAGTTITIKKLDGSTTAATLTMDSATAPTSSTRAT